MYTYAQINDHGICTAESMLSGEVIADHMIPISAMDGSYMGKRWTGSEWTTEGVPSDPPRITSLAFRRRFTTAEQVAIEVASLDDPTATIEVRQQQAALRVYLRNIDVAKFVDLGDPEVISGVSQLEALGLLLPGRAEAILTAPVQPEERA